MLADALRILGTVDILVANHARSGHQNLEQLTAEEIDAHLAVNVRATMLLVKAFAERHDDRRPGGRVVMMTSGQHRGPMSRELGYAASKGAIHQVTASLAWHLAPRGITVNTVNPGPTDTGWATPAEHAEIAEHHPRRVGEAGGRCAPDRLAVDRRRRLDHRPGDRLDRRSVSMGRTRCRFEREWPASSGGCSVSGGLR
jgi:NAD(P)-dependent dehydrogenase (short-subunit alcohol dehydrogenase family)